MSNSIRYAFGLHIDLFKSFVQGSPRIMSKETVFICRTEETIKEWQGFFVPYGNLSESE